MTDRWSDDLRKEADGKWMRKAEDYAMWLTLKKGPCPAKNRLTDPCYLKDILPVILGISKSD